MDASTPRTKEWTLSIQKDGAAVCGKPACSRRAQFTSLSTSLQKNAEALLSV